MRVLAVGDVVGKNGVEFLQDVLPAYRRLEGIDFCVVNGENSSDGNGITPVSLRELYAGGADVVTTGNHAFRRPEMMDVYDEDASVLRPANFPSSVPGRGFCVVDKGRYRIGVVNLMGTTYLEPLGNPFQAADRILPELKEGRFLLGDFHAEATSEKRAMAFYLDGRVSALFGTHTHVQTADEQILPEGTGYITDLGMTGPIQSVLGAKPELAIRKFCTNLPTRFDLVKGGEQMLNGCVFDLDDRNGKTVAVERITLK